MRARLSLVAASLVFASILGAGDAPKDAALTAEIARADAALFEAFNRHDLEGLMALFSEDLEFYHDKDGLLSKGDVRKGFTTLFGRNDGLRRDLVPGSLEIYPVGEWGAIESGAHRFCHEENGKQDCGTFRFVQVWQRTEGGWKVRRVLSYGH